MMEGDDHMVSPRTRALTTFAASLLATTAAPAVTAQTTSSDRASETTGSDALASSMQSPAEADRTTAAAANGQQSGEIIVTAQRRSERLQDVPLSITAISPEAALQLGVTNIRDVKLLTPNVDFSEGVGTIQLYIRGIGSPYASPGLESPVAIYLDGAYLERTYGMNSLLDLVDPGTIEVLRGAQGTLYGRNATGGVVRINSALPTREFEGRVAAEYGRFDRKQLDGMLNIPVSDTLSVRFAGRYKDEDGYITNVATGRKLFGGHGYTARAIIRWEPSSTVDVSLGAEYQSNRLRKDVSGLLDPAKTCYICGPAGTTEQNGFYEVNQNDSPAYKNRIFRTFLRASASFDNFDVTSITSYEDDENKQRSDQDFTPLPVFVFDVLSVGGSTFSQEFQIASTLDGPFNYLAGINYLNDKGHFNTALIGSAYSALGDPEVYNVAKTESVSAFLEGSFKITPELKVTAGGRYTYDRRTITGENNAGFQGFGLPASFKQSPDFRAFTPRFVLGWDNGATNLYYTFNRGFKSGGINTPATSPVRAVNPEKVSSHEIGWKQSMLGGILRSSLSGFYYKISGLQTQTVDATSGGNITENAGGAEGYGAEFELTARPTTGLVIGTSVSYLHAEYTTFPAASTVCFDPSGTLNSAAPGAALYPCTRDYTGRRLPHAPRWQTSLNASYTTKIGDWEANLAGVVQYRTSFDFFPGAGGDLALDRQKGYALANLSGSISPPDGRTRLGFFVDNVFDKKYTIVRITNQPYGATYIAAEPVTYGVRAEYRF
jgi:iron complex outermembrane receptor protein